MAKLNQTEINEIEELYNNYQGRYADRVHDRNWEGAELMEQSMYTSRLILSTLGYKIVKERIGDTVAFHIEPKKGR